MAKSKVFFTDFHASPKANILQKLSKLIEKAGISEIDFDKKLTAIKIHFGEPGNMAYLRPNYAGVVAKNIESKGGLPFLTDSNTLYKGRRSNGVDHLQSAMENGFVPAVTGCQVVIADGIKGLDFVEVEINQKNCKRAKIGAAIANADIVVSVNHFKGHEAAGFGGCLKNIAMGSGSIGGKLEMHSDSKPVIIAENCTACKICEKNCAHDAIHVVKDKKIAVIDYDKCIGCGQCVAVCMYDSAQVKWNSHTMLEKIAEYAMAVLKDKPSFHINFIMDISPNCDCWNFNDVPIAPNIGIVASFDPVAIDQASADLVNKAPVNKGCVIDGHSHTSDKFTAVFPNTNWSAGLEYAEKIGLGTREYELINVTI
jgi:uncharacterized Fe-S center protein